MVKIKGLSFTQIQQRLIGNTVHFKSDCTFFPNFDVKGKVVKVTNLGVEIMIEILTKDRKQLKIGSNMKNLRYEII